MTLPLLRFTLSGLQATLDSHLAGELPRHRFAWELHARLDTLAGLGAPGRTVTRARWLLRAVERGDPGAADALRSVLAALARTVGTTRRTGTRDSPDRNARLAEPERETRRDMAATCRRPAGWPSRSGG